VLTENANHRTDHAVVGALVARAWHLPTDVMAAIRLHHDVEGLGHRNADPETHSLVAAGLLADFLIRRRDGLDPEADWTRHGQAALDWLEVSSDDLSDWTPQLNAVLDAV
jgi:HD-like signal output (HDOD) protein